MSARLERVLPGSPLVETLAGASFLVDVPRPEVEALALRCDRRRFDAGERLFGELEPLDTLLVVLTGKVDIVLAAGEASERVVAEVGAGTPLGEIALLTGRVATATGIAKERTEVLCIPRDHVLDLMVRFPATARAFARVLAQRVRDTDAALGRALSEETAPPPPALAVAEAVTRHGVWRLLRTAFRETVLQHRTELPFLFLTGFAVSLLVARLGIRLGDFSKSSLKDMYVFGLFLLIGTGACAHFVFHRRARRALCVAYGAALGFLANELSVLLAFDVFYLDTTHKDESAKHAYRELYDRAPTIWAILLVVAVAIQATYMRGFYRRAFFIVSQRIRRRFA